MRPRVVQVDRHGRRRIRGDLRLTWARAAASRCRIRNTTGALAIIPRAGRESSHRYGHSRDNASPKDDADMVITRGLPFG